MNKKYYYILVTVFVAIIIIPLVLNPAMPRMLGTATAVLGRGFWLGVLAFVAFIFGIIYVGKRWFLDSLKPKDIPNGLPATATVIRSYQGGMAMRMGVYQYYSLIIEVNVVTDNGETWPAKLEEVLPITQVGMYQSGISFAVKYDPYNHQRICINNTG